MAEEYNRKSAPQRLVLEIVKTGEWSKVQYIHRLECGHSEVRKRAAGTQKISCINCVKAQKAEDILSNLARPVVVAPPIEETWIDGIGEDIAHTEQEIGFIRAGIANSLGIPAEAVDVVMENTDDGMQLSYVMVYLDPDTAKSIASPRPKQIDV
jgi:hypothetical protein